MYLSGKSSVKDHPFVWITQETLNDDKQKPQIICF